MGATAAVALLTVASTVYTTENQKGAQRDAQWMAKKQEDTQTAALQKQKAEEDAQQKQASAVALREQQRSLRSQTQTPRDTILTSPVGVTSPANVGTKTLLGA